MKGLATSSGEFGFEFVSILADAAHAEFHGVVLLVISKFRRDTLD